MEFRSIDATKHASSSHSNKQSAGPAASHTSSHSKPKKIRSFIGRRWLLIVIVMLIIGVGLLAYGYIHTKNQLEAAKNPSTAGQSESQQITNQVSKYLVLPTGETPTLATVNDATKLQNQAFFKNAQNGDKVLIYSKAGTALLYRPSTKMVVEYAPVNFSGQGQ